MLLEPVTAILRIQLYIASSNVPTLSLMFVYQARIYSLQPPESLSAGPTFWRKIPLIFAPHMPLRFSD